MTDANTSLQTPAEASGPSGSGLDRRRATWPVPSAHARTRGGANARIPQGQGPVGAAMNVTSEEADGLVTSVGQVPAERLRTIFDGMVDGVWLVSERGTTTYANDAMAELLGTSSDAMRDREITEFMDPEQWAAMTGFLKRQRKHAGERMELRFRRFDGSDMFGIVAGSPITTSEDVFVGTMLNVSDVTGKRSIDAQVGQSQRPE